MFFFREVKVRNGVFLAVNLGAVLRLSACLFHLIFSYVFNWTVVIPKKHISHFSYCLNKANIEQSAKIEKKESKTKI